MPILVGLFSIGVVSAGLVSDIPLCVDIVDVEVADGVTDLELALVDVMTDGGIAVDVRLVEELELVDGVMVVSVELPNPPVAAVAVERLDPMRFDPVGPGVTLEEKGALVTPLGLVRAIDVVGNDDLTLVLEAVEVRGAPIDVGMPPMVGLEKTAELGMQGACIDV